MLRTSVRRSQRNIVGLFAAASSFSQCTSRHMIVKQELNVSKNWRRKEAPVLWRYLRRDHSIAALNKIPSFVGLRVTLNQSPSKNSLVLLLSLRREYGN